MAPRVFRWGRAGLNLTASPLHVDDQELLRARNVACVQRDLEDGIRKRDGLAPLVTLTGAIHAITNIPLPGPITEPPVEGVGVYWYGLGRQGTLRDEAGVGVTDVPFPGDNFNLTYVPAANRHDGWVYYGTADIRRWNGVTDEVWITNATLTGLTNFGKSGWGPVAWTVAADGIHVLILRSEDAGTTRTFHAGVVLIAWATPGTATDNSPLFTASLNTASPTGLAVYPSQTLAIVDGAYFTGSDLQRGLGSAMGDERKRIYTAPVGGAGSWTTSLLLIAEMGGASLIFIPSRVTDHFLVGDDQLWYGQRCGDGDQHLHLHRYAAGTWTQVERMSAMGWEYFPMFVAGGRVLVARTMTTADPTLRLTESNDGGATWTTRLEAPTNPIYTFACTSHAYESAPGTLRFAVPIEDQRRVYSLTADGSLTQRFSDDNLGDSFFYRGMLVTP